MLPTLSALYLTVTSWLRPLLKCGDTTSERGPNSLLTDSVLLESYYFPGPLFPLAISNPAFQTCVDPLAAHPHLQI